ncbi:MAG TPA: hypothetical protein PLA94_30575 [Myxococcota bacterium]|nr:hypothetical protein [Myxococcota bacterium]HND34401.1 hypothetical protein [Myxococcota bacterium]
MDTKNRRFLLLTPEQIRDPRSGATVRVWPIRPATPAPNDRSYAVIEGDRLDDLAARAYGIPERWWKLADASEELDPLRVLVPGRILPIPKGD